MKRSGKYLIILALLLFGLTVHGDTRRISAADSTVKKGTSYQNMTVTPNESAQALWAALCKYVPPGVTITSLSYNPPSNWFRDQSGLYQNIPPILSVQMKDGIVMTSGYAVNVLGPNEQQGMTQAHGGLMVDADITNAVNTSDISDIATLTINFTSDKTIPGFSFIFSYGTDEYPEYVGTEFNDVFICIFDGNNVCFDSQGNLISVNNAFFNVDNNIQGPNAPLDLEYDGFTCVLQTSQVFSPGSHSIKFAIADVGDNILDAGVFLNSFKFDTTNQGTHPVVDIIEDQVFSIDEKTQGGTTVGTITNLCKYGPITLLHTSNVPEFYLSGWDIVVSNGVVFDATVQNEYVMTIKATLDTTWNNDPWIVHDIADMTIKIEGSNAWPQLDKAVIYDNNGNGIGDSIYVKLKYDFPTTYYLEKADFSWPSGQVNYSENIDNNDISNGNEINFSYAPGATAPVWTDGQSTIDITIDSLGQSSTHSGVLEDGIGPVLKEAQCVKRYKPDNDTLRVRISEPIDVSLISGYSFIIIKKDNVKEIEIEPIAGTVLDLGSESFIEFLIIDLGADAPALGDSLKILHTGPVIDKVNNKAHKDNPPVPFKFVGGNLDSWPQISKAVIYDQDGNGIGDSICMTFDGYFIDSMTAEKADFSWPQNQVNYSETISSNNLYNGNTIAFSYPPGATAPVWTYGTSSITVTIDSLGTDISRSADLTDGIGPILEEASVLRRYIPGNDTFFVRISEAVNVSAIAGNAFVLIKGSGGREINIGPIDPVTDLGNEDYIQFAVTDLGADAPAPGDSLKILHTGTVSDKVANKAHKDNPPVPLKFIDGNVPVKNAYYYDVNGDGIVDRVRVEFVDTVADLDAVTFGVEWVGIGVSASDVTPQYELNSKTNVVLDLNGVFGTTTQIVDRTYGDMALNLTYVETGGKATYDVDDKAGPVIVKATYKLSKFEYQKRVDQDSLEIIFSENVNDISSTKPFLLKTQDDTRYHLELIQASKNANRAKFVVTSIVGVTIPVEGDSIWINSQENVQDDLGNAQEVKDNKRVELIIKYPGFELIPHVLGPEKNNYPELNLFTDVEKSTYILLEPDIRVPMHILELVSCRIKIYDPVGNELASCDGYDDKNDLVAIKPLQLGPNNLIVIHWVDKNYNDRNVGEGAYCGRIEITYSDGTTAVRNVTIPMKEEIEE